MKLIKLTPTGKNSHIEVSDLIFAAPVNQHLLAQAVRVYQFNQRQGTSRVQTRSEVSRTKAKWYRQKGTGRARHGSQNAPIFVGGGVAHGPKGNENWSRTLSKKQRRGALISALAWRCQDMVVSDIPLETTGKTKHAARFLDSITTKRARFLIILAEPDQLARRAFANIPFVLVKTTQQLTSYELLLADQIVLTSTAVAKLEARLLTTQPSAVSASSIKAKQSLTKNASSATEMQSARSAKLAQPTKSADKAKPVSSSRGATSQKSIAKPEATSKIRRASSKQEVK